MLSDPVILHAEDDANDAILFRTAVQKAGISLLLAHVCDGEDAINYLRGDGIYSDRVLYPFPCVLVTDLKMPKVTGFDVLAWIQTQLQRATLPAIVLSGSSQEVDKKRAFELGAQAYWVKPNALHDLVQLARELQDLAGPIHSH